MGKKTLERAPDHSKDELDDKDLQMVRWIQKMPDLEPPPGFVNTVMKAIRTKEVSLWNRIYSWATSPKSITFRPLRLAPLAMLLIGVLFVSALLVVKQKESNYIEGQGQHHVPVVFSVTLPEAQSVSVIGTFNAWAGQGYEMQFNKAKKIWSLTVWLPEGRYEYSFLIDGKKIIPDPEAFFHQEDGFGNRNSVLILRTKNGENV